MKTFNWGRPAPGAPATRVHMDEDEMIVESYQPASDIQAIKDEVSAFRNRSGSTMTSGGTSFAGAVPLTVYNGWVQDWRDNHRQTFTEDAYVALKFNSSEYSLFRSDKLTAV